MSTRNARYFGESTPYDLKELERNAARATSQQMAKGATLLQDAFSGNHYYAWFGGWALKLRGSPRETKDLDLLVLARDIREVRTVLESYNWAIMSFYELNGSCQERMFVDIGEGGQVIGVDIVLAGKLNTPFINEEDSCETIRPAFRTPQGDLVIVIALTWQVEGKLAAWYSRRKHSDFEDLVFLCLTYHRIVRQWSAHLDLDQRSLFYEAYKIDVPEDKRNSMRNILSLA